MHAIDVIRRPLLTEKSTYIMNEEGRYSFEVDPRATKVQIKKAVEELYKVSVERVNTSIKRDKTRRLKYGTIYGKFSKKAIVRLKEGQTIELF